MPTGGCHRVSGASPPATGSRHMALATSSLRITSSSSSVRPCRRTRLGRRNTDAYSSSRSSDMRYRTSPASMESRIRAGGLLGSTPIRPRNDDVGVNKTHLRRHRLSLVSEESGQNLVSGAGQGYCRPRNRLVSSTARTRASSAFKPDAARALATSSLAVSELRRPLNSRLSSMMELMERFCRAAASLRARCVRSAKLIVRRGMVYPPIRHHNPMTCAP